MLKRTGIYTPSLINLGKMQINLDFHVYLHVSAYEKRITEIPP